MEPDGIWVKAWKSPWGYIYIVCLHIHQNCNSRERLWPLTNEPIANRCFKNARWIRSSFIPAVSNTVKSQTVNQWFDSFLLVAGGKSLIVVNRPDTILLPSGTKAIFSDRSYVNGAVSICLWLVWCGRKEQFLYLDHCYQNEAAVMSMNRAKPMRAILPLFKDYKIIVLGDAWILFTRFGKLVEGAECVFLLTTQTESLYRNRKYDLGQVRAVRNYARKLCVLSRNKSQKYQTARGIWCRLQMET